jgi:hypothetical protein
MVRFAVLLVLVVNAANAQYENEYEDEIDISDVVCDGVEDFERIPVTESCYAYW